MSAEERFRRPAFPRAKYTITYVSPVTGEWVRHTFYASRGLPKVTPTPGNAYEGLRW